MLLSAIHNVNGEEKLFTSKEYDLLVFLAEHPNHVFTKEELLTGMNIELEHGTINPETNVTNDNLILTTKIALAHLNEFPNYYNSRYGLTMFEKFLKEKMNEK